MKTSSSPLTLKTAQIHITSRLGIYCRNYRALDWRAYAGMAMLGFFQNLEPLVLRYGIYEVLKFTITIVFYLAFSFSINNCFDAGCDALQKEKSAKNPVAAGLIGFKESLVLSLCTATAGLSLAYLWFKGCFPLYFSLVFLAGAYSTPPLRLKSVPLVDLISHGLFFGVLLYLYGYGVSAFGRFSTGAMLTGMSIFVYSTTLELRNHFDDLQTDISSGLRTTACWLGYDKSKRLLEALLLFHWLFLMAISMLMRPNIAIFFILLVAMTSMKWMKLGHYLRLADLCTCAVLVFLGGFDTSLVQLGVPS